MDALRLEVARRAIDRIIAAEHHDRAARCHAVAVGVGAHRRGLHDARHVVAAEGHGALFRARREDGALGMDLPVALARLVGTGHAQMIADALHRAEDVAVEPAHDGGARQQRDVGHGGQFGDDALAPVEAGLAADLLVLVEQRTAEARALVAKDHALALARGGERRHQAGGAGADHQHIAVRVGLLVLVGVRQLGRGAEARGAADDGLVDLLPEALRPHEGLVVEARDEDRGCQRVDGTHVEVQQGPVVLAPGDEAVIDLDHGGAGVGFLAAALAQFNERVGFGRTRGDHAARAMVLEGAAHQRDAIGHEGGGQRVTGVADVQRAIEGEAQGG